MSKLTYEQERFEEDRMNLLHKIVFKSELDEWENVEKYKSLYHDIYGALPTESGLIEHSSGPLLLLAQERNAHDISHS